MSDATVVIDELKNFLKEKRDYVTSNAGVKEFDVKDDSSLVTKIDYEIEEGARKIIKHLQPDAGIYGEEYGIEGNDQTFWTIDPIDGTAYYVRDLPEYMFMASYVENGEPIASLMYNFALDEMFEASPGKQAKKNGNPIKVSKREFSKKAYFEAETHFDYRGKITHLFSERESFIALPFWRAGYGLAMVAEGKCEARINYKPYGKLYDFLPGFILIRSAGGEVVNIGSDSWDWKNFDTIASNGVTTKDLQEVISGLE